MQLKLGARRAVQMDVSALPAEQRTPLPESELAHYKTFDLIYRALCAILYNYVPTSGHPGGSISSGRIVSSLLFETLNYYPGNPHDQTADLLCYAAGHKAMGLYAMWALRDEIMMLGAPDLVPSDDSDRLRIEDLLGFRRNPVEDIPLFRQFHSKALDGHPTPATPFVPIATGASGVGLSSALGLAIGALDFYGRCAPRVHILEGEGGMTPGRVSEALAAAGTAGLRNAILHVDWNQASIDSDHVCRDGRTTGDYVQWNPEELALLHDWNVIRVPNGADPQEVLTAQRMALSIGNGQPTAVIYRTVKGWRYGIEGRLSHGAGHGLCSDGFFDAMLPLLERYNESLMSCLDPKKRRCEFPESEHAREECFWDALNVIRRIVKDERSMVTMMADRLRRAGNRLSDSQRVPRKNAPRVEAVFESAAKRRGAIPDGLLLEPGAQATLRGELGRVLNHVNRASGGALMVSAADLAGSTSVSVATEGFPEGFYHSKTNPGSRLLALGGICEDAMSGILSGLSAYGRHIGVASSYAAFIAALGHVSSRIHAIGESARSETVGVPAHPFILVCAHAGLQTGEDGPTHADPQPLQLLQSNFPLGTAITLTPWDPQEVWPLMVAALAHRPALIAPFVTRPAVMVPDRVASHLARPEMAGTGVYRLRGRRARRDGTLVLQGCGVTQTFVQQVLPRLDEKGIDLEIYYVASAELFDMLPITRRQRIFPESRAREAMGITDFTLPTMFRWIRSDRGRNLTLHPYRGHQFPGSGRADAVMKQVGLDASAQFVAIQRYLDTMTRRKRSTAGTPKVVAHPSRPRPPAGV